MSKKNAMTQESASRIQSSVDRRGGDAGFKARTSSAAARNTRSSSSSRGSSEGGSSKGSKR